MRPNNIKSVLIDASALIGVIQDEADFRCLRSLLQALDRGDVRLVESTAILAEVLGKHAKDAPAHQRARDTILERLLSPETELVDVSTVVARKAGELKVKHGLGTWDAVHLATAIVAKVDVLIARDRKLKEGDYEGVYVTEPFDIDEGMLFSIPPEPNS